LQYCNCKWALGIVYILSASCLILSVMSVENYLNELWKKYVLETAAQRQGSLLDLVDLPRLCAEFSPQVVVIDPVPESIPQRDETLADLPELVPLRRQLSPEVDLPEGLAVRGHVSSEDDAFDLTSPQNYAVHLRVGLVPREQYDRWQEADAERTSSRRALGRGRLPPVRNSPEYFKWQEDNVQAPAAISTSARMTSSTEKGYLYSFFNLLPFFVLVHHVE